MVQQVDFPVIPDINPGDYQPTVTQLLAYIDKEKPKYRELKRYMRERSIFDKNSVDNLFDFMGVVASKGKKSRLNKTGAVFLTTEDTSDWQNTLFHHIAKKNEILVKYVFDALAERLYSVNEMYRVITSYVYPGKTISLPSFKAWMAWLEATGTIKYIGIRWGLSPASKEVEDYIRGIDVEELLEDEAEEESQLEAEKADLEQKAEDIDSEDEAGGEKPAVTARGKKEKVEEEFPEPVEVEEAPSPVSSTMPAEESIPVSEAPAPLTTYQTRLRLRAVAEIEEIEKVLSIDPDGVDALEESVLLDEAELAKNLEEIRLNWKKAGSERDLTPLSVLDFGIEPKEYKKRGFKQSREYWCYRVMIASVCAFRPVQHSGNSTAGFSPQERFLSLERSGALERHFLQEADLDEVTSLLVAAGYGSRLDILGLLPYMALARQALLQSGDWLSKQDRKKSSVSLWKSVYERLHAGVFSLELIWLVRELYRHGLWTTKAASDVGVVPTQVVLDTSYRLGFINTSYAGNFSALLHVSRMLTALFDSGMGFEAGMKYFADSVGCSFDCRHRYDCIHFCREKLRR